MRRCRLWMACGLVVSTLAGCKSSVTNLTPSTLPREASGLYRFEAEWRSDQQSLRHEDTKAYVVLDRKLYPMERVPFMTNRWETFVPLPEGKNPVFYYYKWDYATQGFGTQSPNSRRSPEYRLEIGDRLSPSP